MYAAFAVGAQAESRTLPLKRTGKIIVETRLGWFKVFCLDIHCSKNTNFMSSLYGGFKTTVE
jgi:hypothetical protein